MLEEMSKALTRISPMMFESSNENDEDSALLITTA
jgi:hypothetical protein